MVNEAACKICLETSCRNRENFSTPAYIDGEFEGCGFGSDHICTPQDRTMIVLLNKLLEK